MARWKARAEFLLSVIELLFLSLTVEALQGKMCQNSMPSGVGRSLGAKISGGKGSSLANIFLVSTKLDTFCYPRCKLHRIRAVVLTHYRRVTVCLSVCPSVTDRRTDRQTDGIAVANTGLAMRALRAL